MSIYKGGARIVKIYKGETKIKEVYKGSTLVLKGGVENVPIYFLSPSGDVGIGCIGYPLPNKTLPAVLTDKTATTYTGGQTLTGISGVLGVTGSTVSVYRGATYTYSFSSSLTDGYGRLWHFYTSSGGFLGDEILVVSPKQQVGDVVAFDNFSIKSLNINSDGTGWSAPTSYGTASGSVPATPTKIGEVVYRA